MSDFEEAQVARFMDGVLACAQLNRGHQWSEPFVDPPPGTEVVGVPIDPKWAVRCENCDIKCLGETPEDALERGAEFDQANFAGRFA